MGNTIGFEKINFFLNTSEGAVKVSGYRLTGANIEGIAVHKDGNTWSATDTLSGSKLLSAEGSRDNLISSMQKKDLFVKIKEYRKKDTYKDACESFKAKVDEYRESAKAEEKPVKSQARKKTGSSSADFTIKKGTREGAYEVYFNEKPSRNILDALKGMNFHWNPKKVCWYGFKDKADVEKALKTA